MKTFEEMENEDGYMMLKFRIALNQGKSLKARNIIHLYLDSSLKLHYSLGSKIILTFKINYILGFKNCS